MKKDLVQTSSIFGTEASQQANKQDTLSANIEQEEEETDIPNIARCRTIKFNKTDANISIVAFFPDSLHCVIYNKLSGNYFAGHMSKELIYEVPIYDFTTTIVSDNTVVLKISNSTLFSDGDRYMILRDGEYILKKELDFVEEEDWASLVIAGKKSSLETTEIKDAHISSNHTSETYYYKDGNFILTDKGELLFEDNRAGSKLLLADSGGSYIGYYLPLSEDGHVKLYGNDFKVLTRLTLTLCVVVELETDQEYLLTCVNQMLLSLDDFMVETWQHISILNGVALLMVDNNSGTILNVFTPNHQRIVLEPKYKVNDKAFGNGLYFEKDNVLLLDNGSLTFTERVDKNIINVRGRDVVIPVEHYGDL